MYRTHLRDAGKKCKYHKQSFYKDHRADEHCAHTINTSRDYFFTALYVTHINTAHMVTVYPLLPRAIYTYMQYQLIKNNKRNSTDKHYKRGVHNSNNFSTSTIYHQLILNSTSIQGKLFHGSMFRHKIRKHGYERCFMIILKLSAVCSRLIYHMVHCITRRLIHNAA